MTYYTIDLQKCQVFVFFFIQGYVALAKSNTFLARLAHPLGQTGL